MMYGKAAAVTANSGEATPIMMSSSHIDQIYYMIAILPITVHCKICAVDCEFNVLPAEKESNAELYSRKC